MKRLFLNKQYQFVAIVVAAILLMIFFSSSGIKKKDEVKIINVSRAFNRHGLVRCDAG